MKISRTIKADDLAKDLPLILSELTRKNEGVFVEAEGRTYRLEPVELEASDPKDLWAHYDPEKVRAAVRKYAGAWADLDTDTMIDNIYQAREEGSHPADRP